MLVNNSRPAHDEKTRVEDRNCVASFEGGFESKQNGLFQSLVYCDDSAVFVDWISATLEEFSHDELSDDVFYHEFIVWLSNEGADSIQSIQGEGFEYYYCSSKDLEELDWVSLANNWKASNV